MSGGTHGLIVAAGRGHRAGEGLPKQYRTVAGKTVLRHAVEALAGTVDRVSVVIHPDDEALYASSIAGLTLPPPVHGGAMRQESVRLGLEALAAAPPARVLIHDAARAFVPGAVTRRVLAALDHDDGATPALPVADSIRSGTSHVEGEVDRTGLHRVQTPQGFRFDAILAAHRAAAPGATDDVAVATAAGLSVAFVEGDERAFKLTTPADFERAEAMFSALMISRVASGYDVHRFGPGDHLWLCGVKIPTPSA